MYWVGTLGMLGWGDILHVWQIGTLEGQRTDCDRVKKYSPNTSISQFTLYGKKKVFADMIKLRALRWGSWYGKIIPVLFGWALRQSHNPYQREEEGEIFTHTEEKRQCDDLGRERKIWRYFGFWRGRKRSWAKEDSQKLEAGKGKECNSRSWKSQEMESLLESLKAARSWQSPWLWPHESVRLLASKTVKE